MTVQTRLVWVIESMPTEGEQSVFKLNLYLPGKLLKWFDVRRLCLLDNSDHFLHTRLVKLVCQTQIVLASRSPELDLLQRAGAGGSVERFLAGEQLLDLSCPVNYHN